MLTHAGIKFTQEQQLKWVWATFLATFLDWVLYSTSKIVLEVWNRWQTRAWLEYGYWVFVAPIANCVVLAQPILCSSCIILPERLSCLCSFLLLTLSRTKCAHVSPAVVTAAIRDGSFLRFVRRGSHYFWILLWGYCGPGKKSLDCRIRSYLRCPPGVMLMDTAYKDFLIGSVGWILC